MKRLLVVGLVLVGAVACSSPKIGTGRAAPSTTPASPPSTAPAVTSTPTTTLAPTTPRIAQTTTTEAGHPAEPSSTYSTPKPAPQSQPAPIQVRTAAPASPYRVWILGDSVMNDASLGVKAALEATGEMSVVVNSAFPGWGLTRDPTWPADFQRTIATYHPQIIMGTWSWDDNQAAANPTLYTQQLQAALRLLLAPGDGVQEVVLLQFPQTGPVNQTSSGIVAWSKQTRLQDAWNAAARTAVTAFPGHAQYLPTDPLFAPGGRFYTWFRTPAGTWVRARKLDNAHFCPYGAAEFGLLIVKDLTPQLGLGNLRPGWELGPWVSDPRYNDPPGACPNDQPPPGYQGIQVPPS
jgi:hypothetical protein